MKKLLLSLCICLLIAFSAFSQVTYLADTAFTTDMGFGGAPASCVFTGGSYFGWENNRGVNAWVADAFTVPAGATWRFDTVIVYGYQWGSGTTSTFLNCNLQIYSGTPGLGGSVIWGDTSTNVMVNTGFTGIYRVDTDASTGSITGNDRPLMYLKLYLAAAPSLNAGTYWLSWTTSGSSTSAPEAPEKVLPGRINPPGQTARQLYNGVWSYMVDNGNDVGMDMIIKASAVVTSVPALNGAPSVVLDQNVPNPFNKLTDISFYMQQGGYAKLSVYNAVGQLVSIPFDGNTDAGKHLITFNADVLPEGVYYYQLNANGHVGSRQMLLVK